MSDDGRRENSLETWLCVFVHNAILRHILLSVSLPYRNTSLLSATQSRGSPLPGTSSELGPRQRPLLLKSLYVGMRARLRSSILFGVSGGRPPPP